MTKDQELNIVKAYKNGFSKTSIKTLYRITPESLNKILKKHNVPTRRRGDVVFKTSDY